jgi:site-specific recombinase XerD
VIRICNPPILMSGRSLASAFCESQLKDAGITNFRFHDLRHTFASHYLMKGGQLCALSSILGQKDLKMTQRYAKLSPEYMDSQRDRMDTIWTQAPIPSSGAPS